MLALFLVFREKAFSFSTLSMMLAIGFFFFSVLFIKVRKFPYYIPNFLGVIMSKCLILLNASSASIICDYSSLAC